MKNKMSLILIVIVLGLFLYNCCLANGIEESNASPSIDFLDHSYAIGKGKTLKLEVETCGITEDMVEISTEWSSSKPEIATVKKGQVKGKKVGRCTVVCEKTYSNGVTLKAECTIAVNELIKKISAPKKMEVGVSRTKKIPDVSLSPTSATVRKLEYTSSDTSIATVNSNGEVTGISTGSCVVTIEATDGGTAKAEIEVNVPSLFSDKSEYTISSKKGLTIQLQCLNTSIDNIDVKNNSNKLFTVDRTTYDFVKGILKIELSPIKKGNGKIIITDKKNKEKVELNIKVAEKADRSYPDEIDIYEKNAVLLNTNGFVLTNIGNPEWGTSYDGTHYLILNFYAVNNSSYELCTLADDMYINGWKTYKSVGITLAPGKKGTCDMKIRNTEEFGIRKLSDLKEINISFYLIDPNTYNRITDNFPVIFTYSPTTAQKTKEPALNKSEYPDIPFDNIRSNPDEHVGMLYGFSGQVFQKHVDGEYIYYFVITDGNQPDLAVAAAEESAGLVQLNEGDYAYFGGMFAGTVTNPTEDGDVSVPVFIANEVLKK